MLREARQPREGHLSTYTLHHPLQQHLDTPWTLGLKYTSSQYPHSTCSSRISQGCPADRYSQRKCKPTSARKNSYKPICNAFRQVTLWLETALHPNLTTVKPCITQALPSPSSSKGLSNFKMSMPALHKLHVSSWWTRSLVKLVSCSFPCHYFNKTFCRYWYLPKDSSKPSSSGCSNKWMPSGMTVEIFAEKVSIFGPFPNFFLHHWQ